MEKKQFENLLIDVYSEKLESGLDIYIAPIENRNNIYVTLSTKFGSGINEFVPKNEKKMIKVPYGVAHFLEHKMFEQENGIDPFTFYSERGADANANTSYNKTTYLFSCTSFLEENINFLLDYVQSPYFTDENVEKEKGIILSECKMYKDKSYSMCYEKILENSFIEDPIRIPVIGTEESINSITKEDLYKCYNTFYHPSNMFMVITGNVEPKSVIKIIKDNQDKKKFEPFSKINIKKYNEPKKVLKEKDEIKMDITIPKVMLAYKIPLCKFKNIDLNKARDYISIIFDINFGDSSLINEKLVNEKIVNGGIGLEVVNTDNYILFIIAGESENINEFTKEIDKAVKNLSITAEELERKKKTYIGNIVAQSNSVYIINSKIMSNIIKYGEIKYDDYSYTKNLSIEEANFVLKNIDLSHRTICTVKNKEA